MPGPRICASTESDRDPGRGGGAVLVKAGGNKKAGFNFEVSDFHLQKCRGRQPGKGDTGQDHQRDCGEERL
jgi:hypothetical protein